MHRALHDARPSTSLLSASGCRDARGGRAAMPASVRHLIGAGGERWICFPRVRWHTLHPVPDERASRQRRRDCASQGPHIRGDLLVVLLSEAPPRWSRYRPRASRLTTSSRPRCVCWTLGAEIHELNTVRKHLWSIKGGWLAAAHAGSVITLALSDVVGDDLSSIDPGQPCPDSTTFRR